MQSSASVPPGHTLPSITKYISCIYLTLPSTLSMSYPCNIVHVLLLHIRIPPQFLSYSLPEPHNSTCLPVGLLTGCLA